jgi:hypothetical protein
MDVKIEERQGWNVDVEFEYTEGKKQLHFQWLVYQNLWWRSLGTCLKFWRGELRVYAPPSWKKYTSTYM